MLESSEDVEQDGGHDYALPHGDTNSDTSQDDNNQNTRERTRMQFDHDHDYDNPTAAVSADQLVEEQQAVRPVENPTTSSAIVQLELSDDALAGSDMVDLTNTPTQSKKRKRLSKSITPKVKATPVKDANTGDNDEEDDGLTCPICLDNWEMSGEHRLVSLKCGHLFGNSCIRRWMAESGRQAGIKTCPQCKSRAMPKDVRFLYAKRVRAIDRTEEHRLRDELDEEKRNTQSIKAELATLKVSYALVNAKAQTLEADNERMKHMMRVGGGGGSYNYDSNPKELARLPVCKLYMERNVEISREAGCRVMRHADLNSSMIVSQKSTQSLFPGFGLRFIDTPTFRTSNFLHTSGKMLRDIGLSTDQQLVAVASMEARCKLFDIRSPQSAGTIYTPSEKMLWSCAIDRAEREHFLYLGAQHGSTYVYDMRHTDRVLDEFRVESDLSPVINVSAVPANKFFPGGGFIVLKLQSLFFYEYSISSTTTVPARLNVDGPFISMNFDATHETLLVHVRNSNRVPVSRYMLGKLEKIDNIPVFNVQSTFNGSSTSPVMTRCAQLAVRDNTLIAGYLQDVKHLAIYDARRGARAQSIPVHDVVYDMCPIYATNATYLAALTETKCRIYKLTSTNSQE